MLELLRVDEAEWRDEVPLIRAFYASFAEHLPPALVDQVDALEQRLS
jgi:GTP-dependent phosphoenolpyruvate carboxykinase